MKEEKSIKRRGGRRPGAGRKKIGCRTISLTIPEAIAERLYRATDNRSRYISDLLDRELPPLPAADKS